MLVFVVFGRVVGFDFVHYDDNHYVFENSHTLHGFTLESAAAAFTTVQYASWTPLTFWSHMLDVQLFGVHPGAHHLGNVLLHAANTVLLFLLFRRMTRAFWPSAVLAALFAIHPLHVEAVAWISSRKDVLSTFFGLLALHAYCSYAKRPARWGYVAVAGLYLLGLLCKPMLVTLPLVLLILDFWPLRRIDERPEAPSLIRAWLPCLVEKLPLVVIAVVFSVVAFVAEHYGGAVSGLGKIPLSWRLGNAAVAYLRYVGKVIIPVRLAVHYPHPGPHLTGLQIASSLAALTVVSVLVFRARRSSPHALAGWAWFVGTLLPVIGIIQIGSHAMTDRFAYVPDIGLFFMIVWGLGELAGRLRLGRQWLAPATVLVLAALAFLSWRQVGYWRNSETLFTHAVAAVPQNAKMHVALGCEYDRQGRHSRATEQFRIACEINPHYRSAHLFLASALAEEHRYDEAARELGEAIRLAPADSDAYFRLAEVLDLAGRPKEAQAARSRGAALLAASGETPSGGHAREDPAGPSD